MENSKLDEYIIKSSETCIISEVQQEGSSARITFQLKNGDLLERVIRDSDVCYLYFLNHRIFALQKIIFLIIRFMVFAIP